MPIDIQGSILSTGRLANPGTPGVFGGLAQGMQARNEIELRKQQLEQQKMQFEQQRQQQEAQLALQRQRMAYDMAEADRIKEQQRQAALKKETDEKLALQTKHTQALLSGDEVGADAILPEFEARGGLAVLERRENGLPVYRYYLDAAERAKEDKEFARRQNMARASDIRPEDVTIQRGGTVLDVPAAEARRQAQVSVVLDEQEQAYSTDEEKEIARASARAALRVPGSTAERLKAYDSLSSDAMQNYRNRQQGESTVNAARESRAQNAEGRSDVKLKREGIQLGREDAATAAKNIDLQNYRDQYESLKLSAEAMASSSPTDHQIAGRNLARVLANEKGPMSNQDISGVLGNDTESFIDRIKKGLYKEAFGGMDPGKRDALAKLAEKKLGTMQERLYGYMDRVEEMASKETDADRAEGMRGYLELNTDEADRAEWRKRRDAKKPPPAEQPTGSAAQPASVDGKQLIKDFEGKRLEAYPDASGHSIGYGHFGAKPGDKIDEATADKLFEEDYARFAKVVDEVAPNATPAQRDAMISLAYNIGEQGFRDSSVAKLHAAGDTKGAAEAFDLYNKSEGKTNSTLVLRRKRERELYESKAAEPVYQPKNETEARLIELFKKG